MIGSVKHPKMQAEKKSHILSERPKLLQTSIYDSKVLYFTYVLSALPSFLKQCGSRSAGFWRSQLIRIHTFHPHIESIFNNTGLTIKSMLIRACKKQKVYQILSTFLHIFTLFVYIPTWLVQAKLLSYRQKKETNKMTKWVDVPKEDIFRLVICLVCCSQLKTHSDFGKTVETDVNANISISSTLDLNLHHGIWAFWQVQTQTSLCSLLLHLETPSAVRSVA